MQNRQGQKMLLSEYSMMQLNNLDTHVLRDPLKTFFVFLSSKGNVNHESIAQWTFKTHTCFYYFCFVLFIWMSLSHTGKKRQNGIYDKLSNMLKR